MATRFTLNADLGDDIAKKKVVLFVGAGASRWATPRGGGSFKGWGEFLTDAAKMLPTASLRKLVNGRVKAGDFLIASELLKRNLGAEWQRLLADEFQQAADIPRLHKALINLQQRLVITTNFDKLLETAWHDSAPPRYPNLITRLDAKVFRLFRDDEPYLIKLHGTIDDVDTIVFDKSSYQRNAFDNQSYRDLIGTLLLTHTFLFVGFSMDDPAVASIVDSHAFRYADTRPHYIFTPGTPKPPADDLSRSLRKLFVLRYPDKDNHVALAEALEQLAEFGKERHRLMAS